MRKIDFKDFEQVGKDEIFESTVNLYNQFKYKNFAAGLKKKNLKIDCLNQILVYL